MLSDPAETACPTCGAPELMGKAVSIEHTQAPSDPSDGDTFACACGVSYEFVVLDDGLPGEWVEVS